VEKFVSRFGSAVTAVVSGFDRLVFRGTLLPLVMERGMHTLLARAGVRLLDFKRYAFTTSERVREASLHEALEHDRPARYLQWSGTDKGGSRPSPAPGASDRGRSGLRLPHRRALYEFRVPSFGRSQRTRSLPAAAKVPPHLQVLPSSRLRFPRHATPNLVSVQRPDLAQRPGVARPPAQTGISLAQWARSKKIKKTASGYQKVA
jgi:hypothetical protein